ncbi:hypothetical protein P4H70_06590 [Paenibacillus ehimensis]|uniref:hypothetical protein n=1 Tax=Paenibacillus ehimensis TaxID=79264 RepID=UPI002CA2CA8C|nr:hypothetical protein [Paenibacillus ehimensis]MEC0208615.1 hypothetical protein [Paenibacillus ehimensis]HWO95572.1 hypothetical protein [Bacillus sp. (in: firmicutes)]
MKSFFVFISFVLIFGFLCFYWFYFYYQKNEHGIPIPNKAILKEKTVSTERVMYIYRLDGLQQTDGFPESYKIRLKLSGWNYSGIESEGALFVFKKNDGSKLYISIYNDEFSLSMPN